MAVLTYSQTLFRNRSSQRMAILTLGSSKSSNPSLAPGYYRFLRIALAGAPSCPRTLIGRTIAS